MARPSVHLGSVIGFDDPAGLGEVRDDDGVTHRFHCTALTDGTRSVAVGTRVAHEVVVARDGCTEAVAVTPLAPAPPVVTPREARPPGAP